MWKPQFSGGFLRERPKETWNEASGSDLKEKKVSKDVAKSRNVWKFFHAK